MNRIKSKRFLIIVTFIALLNLNESNAQKTTIEQDSIQIEFVKNEKLNKKHPKPYIGTILNGFRITLIEVDIKTLNLKKTEFDPNKFYLVSESPKFRYRPLDIFLIKGKKEWVSFGLVTKKKPFKTNNSKFTYNPEIKDTYLDYKIEGVSDIKIPIEIGTQRQSDKHIFHFKPDFIDENKIALYFYLTSEFIKRGTLYYGNDKIIETELE